MMEENNNLQIVDIVKQSGIATTEGQNIIDTFSGFYKTASSLIETAKSIVVVDENDHDSMSRARDIRLQLQKLRTTTDRRRVEMKEEYLKKGKAVDLVAKLVKTSIEPIEEELEGKERFAYNLKKEREEEAYQIRAKELGLYVEDISLYNFRDMNAPVFTNLIKKVKAEKESKDEEIRLVEEERLKKEEEEKKEHERLRLENEKLKEEKRVQDEKIAEEKRIEDEKRAEEKHIEAEKQAEINQKKDEEIRLANEKREAAEKEIKEREAEETRMKLEKEEKERLALLAPDKDKLVKFAEDIRNVYSPVGLSDSSQKHVLSITNKLISLSDELKAIIKSEYE